MCFVYTHTRTHTHIYTYVYQLIYWQRVGTTQPVILLVIAMDGWIYFFWTLVRYGDTPVTGGRGSNRQVLGNQGELLS